MRRYGFPKTGEFEDEDYRVTRLSRLPGRKLRPDTQTTSSAAFESALVLVPVAISRA